MLEAVSQLYSESFPHVLWYFFPGTFSTKVNGSFERFKTILAFRALHQVLFNLLAGVGSQFSVQIFGNPFKIFLAVLLHALFPSW